MKTMSAAELFGTSDFVEGFGPYYENRAMRRNHHRAAGLPMSRSSDKWKETMSPSVKTRKR